MNLDEVAPLIAVVTRLERRLADLEARVEATRPTADYSCANLPSDIRTQRTFRYHAGRVPGCYRIGKALHVPRDAWQAYRRGTPTDTASPVDMTDPLDAALAASVRFTRH
jgi:hypothetical protein